MGEESFLRNVAKLSVIKYQKFKKQKGREGGRERGKERKKGGKGRGGERERKKRRKQDFKFYPRISCLEFGFTQSMLFS